MKKLLVTFIILVCSYSALGISGGVPYQATAYNLRGKTASGIYVRRGIVAADPRLHKLGSYVWVNAGEYSGKYLVADTGKKIKGRIIDIWMPGKEPRKFGRRKVWVYAL
jgi:3D (Asp-Asp-Asp) domain-containing protein